jgi:enamine deaminase RidA (YjgF/YER057c/UK114 family)
LPRPIENSTASSALPGSLPIFVKDYSVRLYLHPNARYSKAVSHNGISFLSAVYALKEGQSARDQIIEVLNTIDGFLAELGSTKADVLKATVFVADVLDFPDINEVWDGWVAPGHPPARTPIFGPLLRPDAKVGVELTVASRL